MRTLGVGKDGKQSVPQSSLTVTQVTVVFSRGCAKTRRSR